MYHCDATWLHLQVWYNKPTWTSLIQLHYMYQCDATTYTACALVTICVRMFTVYCMFHSILIRLHVPVWFNKASCISLNYKFVFSFVISVVSLYLSFVWSLIVVLLALILTKMERFGVLYLPQPFGNLHYHEDSSRLWWRVIEIKCSVPFQHISHFTKKYKQNYFNTISTLKFCI